MFKIKACLSWQDQMGKHSIERGGVYEFVASTKEELKTLLLKLTEENKEVRFDGCKKVSKESIEQTEEKMREINYYSAYKEWERWIIK